MACGGPASRMTGKESVIEKGKGRLYWSHSSHEKRTNGRWGLGGLGVKTYLKTRLRKEVAKRAERCRGGEL